MDMLIGAVVLLLVGTASYYIRKKKKQGVACIGCPSACHCGKKENGGCH